jgi:membrane protein
MKPQITRMVLQAINRLFADQALPLAGNIAFRTLFSVFPFLVFLTALGGFVGNELLASQVVDFLLSVAPPQLVEPLSPEIHAILTERRGGLLSVSALITIWSAMAGVDSVRAALNRAYGVREYRSFLWLTLQGVVFVIGGAILLLMLALFLVLAPVIIEFLNIHAPALQPLTATFDKWRYPMAVVLLTGALTVAHRVLPAREVTTLSVLPGVLLTVVLWVALSAAYGYFLANFASFASTYAGLSGIFGAMFFLYLAAVGLIFGGEINRVIAIWREISAMIALQEAQEKERAENPDEPVTGEVAEATDDAPNV